MTAIDLSPHTARARLAGLVRRSAYDDDRGVVEHYARAVWSCLVEPGDAVAGRLVGALGAAEALRAALDDGRAVDPATDLSRQQLAQARARWRPRVGDASHPLRTAREARVRLVTPDDPEWPDALNDLGDHAPLCLWVRGDPRLLPRDRPAVAFVGARAATGYGEHVVMDWAAELAASGVTIVSGAAYGIDGMAHRAALNAGGVTVAMLAGGVDRAYPAGHTELLARIAAHGVVASEVPCGSAPTKWRFLQRNRSISALAQATVVVEAGWRSGSLNTAGHAATLGRPLGAVPGPITSGASAGCHRLLREFDARCVTCVDDVRELLGLAVDGGPIGEDALAGPRTDERTRILDALSARTARTTDDVARRCGMSTSQAEALLGLLILDGTVERGPSGWRRSPRP